MPMRFPIAAVIAALSQAPALAADMAVKATPLPAPVYGWTGWYAGVNAGWVGSTGNQNTNATIFSFPQDPTTSTTLAAAATNQIGNRSNGFIGGGQFGYNYQWQSLVAGFETDIQGASLRGTSSTSNSVLTDTISGINTATWNTGTTVSRHLDYLGTVRARLGVTATPTFLLYGTGGLAYGGVSSNTSMSIAANFLNGTPVDRVTPALTAGSYSDTRAGWAAGAGGEWMFLPNWSAKLEYLHYDLGSATYATGGYSIDVRPTSLPGSGAAAMGTTTTDRFRGDIVRVGANYQFH